MKGYRANIKDGREIYIPHWPVNVALENLTQAGKYIGTQNIINISELNIPATIIAITTCKEPKIVSALVRDFICQVAIDGDRVTKETIDALFEGNLYVVVELFAHTIHSQYADFFELGLPKVPSQDK